MKANHDERVGLLHVRVQLSGHLRRRFRSVDNPGIIDEVPPLSRGLLDRFVKGRIVLELIPESITDEEDHCSPPPGPSCFGFSVPGRRSSSRLSISLVSVPKVSFRYALWPASP